jgi:hypothetical protein
MSCKTGRAATAGPRLTLVEGRVPLHHAGFALPVLDEHEVDLCGTCVRSARGSRATDAGQPHPPSWPAIKKIFVWSAPGSREVCIRTMAGVDTRVSVSPFERLYIKSGAAGRAK